MKTSQATARYSHSIGTSNEENDEKITKVLTANNPNILNPVSRYDYSEGGYKIDTSVDHLAVHFEMIGTWEELEIEEGGHVSVVRSVSRTGAAEKNADAAIFGRKKNAFDFSDRGTQSLFTSTFERGVQTKPPPTKNASGTVSPWVIYDYSQVLSCKHMPVTERSIDAFESRKLCNALKTIEWMIHQNDTPSKNRLTISKLDALAFGISRHDSSYTMMSRGISTNDSTTKVGEFTKTDSSDSVVRLNNLISGNEPVKHGHLFAPNGQSPLKLTELFKFLPVRQAKRLSVTSMAWSPRYSDLVVVGYGTYDLTNQGKGLVCLYSLRNTDHPELSIMTEAGVMCVDLHNCMPNLLAAGLYDGTVCVFDLSMKNDNLVYKGKRCESLEPLWEVVWETKEQSKGTQTSAYFSPSAPSASHPATTNFDNPTHNKHPVI